MTLFGDDWPPAAPPEEPTAPTLPAPADAAAEAGPDRRALYLRWRPKRFEDVVGQEHVTRTLRNAVVHGRLAHAYLFTGPRGTGKTSVARILYRAANCPNTVDGDPCNACPLCVSSLEGRTMDLIEIDAASNRGIDDIRDLRERVGYRPGEGRYRVYIIDEAHELTTTAWDAFLKTLEEPPPHVIFALATTEAHKVPATIISRCQRFDFRRIPYEAIRDQLARVAEDEGIEVEPSVLERLARSARGGLRDGLSLLDQLSAFAGGRVSMDVARAVLGLPPAESVRDVLDSLGRRDAARAMAVLLDLVESGVDLRQFAEELIAHMRALLLVRVGAEAPLALEFSADDLDWLRVQASAWSTGVLMTAIRDLTQYLVRTRDGQQFQVQLELTLLATCQEAIATPTTIASAPPPGVSPTPPTSARQAPPPSTRPSPHSSDSPNPPMSAGSNSPSSDGPNSPAGAGSTSHTPPASAGPVPTLSSTRTTPPPADYATTDSPTDSTSTYLNRDTTHPAATALPAHGALGDASQSAAASELAPPIPASPAPAAPVPASPPHSATASSARAPQISPSHGTPDSPTSSTPASFESAAPSSPAPGAPSASGNVTSGPLPQSHPANGRAVTSQSSTPTVFDTLSQSDAGLPVAPPPPAPSHEQIPPLPVTNVTTVSAAPPDGATESAPAAPPTPPLPPPVADVQSLRERWADVVERVASKKPLLGASLSTAHPVRFESERHLVVAFGTRFSCQKAESPAARKLIEEAIARVVGTPIVLRCVIEDSESGQPALMDDPVIAFAAKAFGGQPRRVPPGELEADTDA